jgi:hypothetical protein
LRPAALASGSTVLIAPPVPTAVGILAVGPRSSEADGAALAALVTGGTRSAAATARLLAADAVAAILLEKWGMVVPPERRPATLPLAPGTFPRPSGC